MSDEIKILITSDIHLGCDNGGISVPHSVRVNTFRKITSLAREHDIFLIAGDLMDCVSVPDSIVSLIREEFESIRAGGTDILYTPGFGEQNGNGELPGFIEELGATHIFLNRDGPVPYRTRRGAQEICVYGAPARDDFSITAVKREDGPGFHMGLFHCDFSFQNNKSELRSLELDFYALGHDHTFRMFRVFDRIMGAHPGSPEAVMPDETGDRYVISMLVKGDEIFQIKRLLVNSMRLRNEEIDCSAYSGLEELRDRLLDGASQKEVLTVKLKGSRDFPLGDEFEKTGRYFFDMRVVDETVPTLRSLVETYHLENTIRGEFYRVLKERLARGEISGETAGGSISPALKILTGDGFDAMEEWLCDL